MFYIFCSANMYLLINSMIFVTVPTLQLTWLWVEWLLRLQLGRWTPGMHQAWQLMAMLIQSIVIGAVFVLGTRTTPGGEWTWGVCMTSQQL